jgi:hypothetical protein
MRNISFKPTSRRSSHASPNQTACPPGTVRVTALTASREASAQVAQVFGTHNRPRPIVTSSAMAASWSSPAPRAPGRTTVTCSRTRRRRSCREPRSHSRGRRGQRVKLGGRQERAVLASRRDRDPLAGKRILAQGRGRRPRFRPPRVLGPVGGQGRIRVVEIDELAPIAQAGDALGDRGHRGVRLLVPVQSQVAGQGDAASE